MNLDQFKKNNKFLMLALDHRGSFKKLMNPENPDSVTHEEVINLKREIIGALEDQISGMLIDEVYDIPPDMQKGKPFLLPLEKSGYTEEKGERITELEKSVEEIKALGASGAKLLLYFNPFLPSAIKQLELVKKVVDECRQNDFPLFLEVVTYELEGKEEDREKLVLGSLDMFINASVVPNVWKLEYPGSLEGCNLITKKVEGTPWILLTRGVTFDEFLLQLKDAISSGAKGFLAGRALWQEICKLTGEEKRKFLQETLPERFKMIAEIALSQ